MSGFYTPCMSLMLAPLITGGAASPAVSGDKGPKNKRLVVGEEVRVWTGSRFRCRFGGCHAGLVRFRGARADLRDTPEQPPAWGGKSGA
jgi:hypothetical protein